MPLIYITGISGSGKTTVRNELRHRGHIAYGTDEDSLAHFYNNDTGEQIRHHVTAEDRTPEWRSHHTWKVERAAVEKLREEAKGKPIFLCGVVSNDTRELWDLFDAVFALTINEETLRHRITTRTNNDHGKNPHEFEELLKWQKTAREDYEKLEAIIVDATKPVETVVDEILNKVIDFSQIGQESLQAYIHTIKNLVESSEPFDAIIAAGDSGQLVTRITKEVYEVLDKPVPPTLIAPIYRHADEAETILFDNTTLAPQFPSWNNKLLTNVLFVDDEIGSGNALRGMLDLLLELSPKVQHLTIVAEDGGFDCPPETQGVKTTFMPTQKRIPNIYNAISKNIPSEFKVTLDKVLADEPYLNNKQIMCTLLNLPTKEFKVGRPEFNERLIERAKARLPEFKVMQSQYQEYFQAQIRECL